MNTQNASEPGTSPVHTSQKPEEKTEDMRAQAGSNVPSQLLDPAEAGRRSGAARRAKREAREKAAELDRLTVKQRASAVLAKQATAERQEALLDSLHNDATSTKNTATQRTAAAKAYMDILDRAIGRDTDEDVDEELPWEKMSPAQRATARANLLALAEKQAEDARSAAAEHEVER